MFFVLIIQFNITSFFSPSVKNFVFATSLVRGRQGKEGSLTVSALPEGEPRKLPKPYGRCLKSVNSRYKPAGEAFRLPLNFTRRVCGTGDASPAEDNIKPPYGFHTEVRFLFAQIVRDIRRFKAV